MAVIEGSFICEKEDVMKPQTGNISLQAEEEKFPLKSAGDFWVNFYSRW